MLAMLRGGHRLRAKYAGKTFGQFLEATGQTDETIRLFWDTIIISACNLPSSSTAAVHGMQVFQEAFLPGRWAGTMGLSTVPLAELYDPAESIIAEVGGSIELGRSVRSITIGDDGVEGIVTNDGPRAASTVISTVPPDRLAKLVPERWVKRDARLAHLDAFETSPILGVHLLLDAKAFDHPHMVLPGHDVHWIFNKGCNEQGQQHLHAVISAADNWMELDEDAIVNRVLDDLHSALPSTADRTIVNARSVKEKRATFAATADIEPKRPASGPSTIGVGGGDAQGLFLAGDWCATGWPATMEGAVRSGYLAAEAVCGAGGLVDDLPPDRLASLLGSR